MKNITKVQNEIINDHKIIDNNENLKITITSYDKTIARVRDISLHDPSEYLREYYKKVYEDYIFEKELVIKSSLSIIKSAIKGATRDIVIYYPSIMNWKEEHRFFQLTTKRRPFILDAIEELGKRFKSITCVCKDGVERTFEIRKIEAFYGVNKTRKGKVSQCVNVYF